MTFSKGRRRTRSGPATMTPKHQSTEYADHPGAKSKRKNSLQSKQILLLVQAPMMPKQHNHSIVINKPHNSPVKFSEESVTEETKSATDKKRKQLYNQWKEHSQESCQRRAQHQLTSTIHLMTNMSTLRRPLLAQGLTYQFMNPQK